MPALSKEKGISFNGFSVDNKNGYYLTNVTIPAKPEQTYTAQYLPGRSETVYGSGGYKDIPITVEVAIRYSDLQDRNNKINAIMQAWCFTESKLKLKHNAYFYVGKVLDEVSISEDGFYTILSFPFICKPFMFSEKHTVTLQPTNTIDYKGDYKCQPVFKFGGAGTHTVSLNGESFTITMDGRNITVDCAKGIVYYDDITNAMSQFEGDMVTLKPNVINTITVSSSGEYTAPTLEYQDTNLCKRKYE